MCATSTPCEYHQNKLSLCCIYLSIYFFILFICLFISLLYLFSYFINLFVYSFIHLFFFCSYNFLCILVSSFIILVFMSFIYPIYLLLFSLKKSLCSTNFANFFFLFFNLSVISYLVRSISYFLLFVDFSCLF